MYLKDYAMVGQMTMRKRRFDRFLALGVSLFVLATSICIHHMAMPDLDNGAPVQAVDHADLKELLLGEKESHSPRSQIPLMDPASSTAEKAHTLLPETHSEELSILRC